MFSNNVEYMGVEPEFLYYANVKKSISISAPIVDALKGQNVVAAPPISVGVFAEF